MSVSQGSKIVLTSKTKKILIAISLLIVAITASIIIYEMQSKEKFTDFCHVDPTTYRNEIKKGC